MALHRKPPPGNTRRTQAITNNLRYTLTNKVGRLVQCESYQERKLALLLERDSSVKDYGSQPEKLTWIDEAGRTHHYTPDFIVWRTTGLTELHEVTLHSRQESRRIQGRQQAALTICQERHWQYVLHLETDLPSDRQMANLLALYGYRSTSYAHPKVVSALAFVLDENGRAFADILNCLIESLSESIAVIYPTLLHALWQGKLFANLDHALFSHGIFRSDEMIYPGKAFRCNT